MKYIYLLILLCNYCYCQDTTNVYQNIEKQEKLLNQGGYNEERINTFKNQSPFHGSLSEQEIQETKHSSKSSTQTVDIGNYSEDSNVSPNSKKENILGFNPQDETWDRVHYNDASNNPVSFDTNYDYTDWEGILVTTGLILFLIGAGVFLYKLLK